MNGRLFWSSFVYSAILSVAMNLGLAISNIIGPRALLNFVTGRYHSPVEEDRFVLFVDIAGSTGLAERLGGVGIHRFLDRTFRLLTVAVEDYRGEVLSYVGDEVIVTWPRRGGAIDCRPLHCFMAMRDEQQFIKMFFFGGAQRIALARGIVDRIGGTSSLRFEAVGSTEKQESAAVRDHEEAVGKVIEWLNSHPQLRLFDAVGHRVVHGGDRFTSSVCIDEQVIDALDALCEIAPLHNPASVSGIRAARSVLGAGMPMVAAFDTFFPSYPTGICVHVRHPLRAICEARYSALRLPRACAPIFSLALRRANGNR